MNEYPRAGYRPRQCVGRLHGQLESPFDFLLHTYPLHALLDIAVELRVGNLGIAVEVPNGLLSQNVTEVKTFHVGFPEFKHHIPLMFVRLKAEHLGIFEPFLRKVEVHDAGIDRTLDIADVAGRKRLTIGPPSTKTSLT